MRISKKDKVDVKKFMEEIKANKTNRSYVQTETKSKPPVEVVSYPQQRYIPKYYGLPSQRDIYRPPPIPYEDPQRYNFNHQADYRMHQPYSNPYISKRSINDIMSQQSQHFNAHTTFQHPPQVMMNCSQSYSSPNYFPYYAQNAQINQNNYSELLLHQKSQLKQTQSKQQIQKRQYFSLQKSDKQEEDINTKRQENTIAVEEKITQSIHKQDKNQNVQTQKKRSVSENKIEKKEETKVQTVVPKKRKPREKKKVVSPKKKEQISMQIETEKKNEPKVDSISISKKFDEIMEREKKKIQEKLQHQRKIKQIMENYNERVQALGQKYFTKSLIDSINNFKQRVFDLIDNYEEKCDQEFNQKLVF